MQGDNVRGYLSPEALSGLADFMDTRQKDQDVTAGLRKRHLNRVCEPLYEWP